MLSANAADPGLDPGRQSLARDQQLLASDLSCVSGTLREVATVWRRAKKSRPGLPLFLPVQLDDAAGRLAATTAMLAGAGPRPPLDQWCRAAERLSVLRAEIAAAQAQTCGAGRPPIGDAGLWATIEAAMRRAARRLLSLIVQAAPAVDWTVGEPDGAGHAGLLIRLR
jgi:hypothetical protein